MRRHDESVKLATSSALAADVINDNDTCHNLNINQTTAGTQNYCGVFAFNSANGDQIWNYSLSAIFSPVNVVSSTLFADCGTFGSA